MCQWYLAVLPALILAMGCDRASNSSSPATAPAPVPAPELPAPATAPATSPTASFLHINNRLVMFPPAKLKLTDEGSRIMALLYTDDPPDAIKDDYTGNSYYLHMALDVGDIKDLAKATWSHKSRTSEREDSPYGIYLTGHKIQLQPHDQVRATFTAAQEGTTTVTLSGQFLLWNDADSTGLPQDVIVSGEIPVTIESDLKTADAK